MTAFVKELLFDNGYGGFDTQRNEYVIYNSTPLPWINCISTVEGTPFGFIVSEKGGGYVWQDNSREAPVTRWYSDPIEDLSDEQIEIIAVNGEEKRKLLPLRQSIARHGYGYSSFEGASDGIKWLFTVFVPLKSPVKITLFSIEAEADLRIVLNYKVDTPYEHEVYSSNDDNLRGVLLLAKNMAGLEDFKNYRACVNALEEVKDYWNNYLNKITVKTPDESINVMMNGRLLYQAVSCRLNGRTAFYQCGGAYGFRDQLQDCLSLLYVNPQRVKECILLHASRQYEEGDVQHWWHPPENSGIRSRYSDDLLWLVYVTWQYITATGDKQILRIKIPFIKSKILDFGETDRYETPEISCKAASLYEHCLLACKYATVYGEHGLPLMKGGDWNDGMNRVGIQGKGESVWLGWFLCYCLKAMDKMSLLMRASETQRLSLQREARKLCESIENNAWDGAWYIRAFCDNGRILGSRHSNECIIDSIAQAWAVLSEEGNPERCKRALLSAEQHLADYEHGIIKLLTPPFSVDSVDDVGYIAAYPAGIRENGAQYTHAAVWLGRAFIRLGKDIKDDNLIEKGRKIIKAINPVNHTRTELEVSVYKIEPYAVAADIYSGANAGRGGWSWYTGSASWLYQTVLEDLLGFSVKNSEVNGCAEAILSTCFPEKWGGYTIEYKFKSSEYIFNIKTNGITRKIPLADDGKIHKYII